MKTPSLCERERRVLRFAIKKVAWETLNPIQWLLNGLYALIGAGVVFILGTIALTILTFHVSAEAALVMAVFGAVLGYAASVGWEVRAAAKTRLSFVQTHRCVEGTVIAVEDREITGYGLFDCVCVTTVKVRTAAGEVAYTMEPDDDYPIQGKPYIVWLPNTQ